PNANRERHIATVGSCPHRNIQLLAGGDRWGAQPYAGRLWRGVGVAVPVESATGARLRRRREGHAYRGVDAERVISDPCGERPGPRVPRLRLLPRARTDLSRVERMVPANLFARTGRGGLHVHPVLAVGGEPDAVEFTRQIRVDILE